MPPPCKDGSYPFTSSRVTKPENYQGDHTKFDFIVDGVKEFHGKDLVLVLDERKMGGSAYSTRYIHYGVVSVAIIPPLGVEVKGDFALRADNNKEEIGFQFDGGNPEETITSYRATGRSNSTYPAYLDVDPTEYSHIKFTIDWNEDRIEWKVNDELVRSVSAEDSAYPTKPARIRLGFWNSKIKYQPDHEAKGKRKKKRNTRFQIQFSELYVECTGTSQVTEKELLPLLPKPIKFDDDNKGCLLTKSLLMSMIVITLIILI